MTDCGSESRILSFEQTETGVYLCVSDFGFANLCLDRSVQLTDT
jgi:hypothetical protein